jgi:hypothetical protein
MHRQRRGDRPTGGPELAFEALQPTTRPARHRVSLGAAHEGPRAQVTSVTIRRLSESGSTLS